MTKKQQAHSLNFFGRVKLPSKKNFLLVASILKSQLRSGFT
jgi:hypothetical protein